MSKGFTKDEDIAPEFSSVQGGVEYCVLLRTVGVFVLGGCEGNGRNAFLSEDLMLELDVLA